MLKNWQWRRMSASWSGSVILKAHTKYSRHLPRHHDSLPCRQHNLLTHLHQHRPPQKLNVVNSLSCSVISWTPQNFPPNSTPKSTEKSSVPINRLVRKSLPALTGTSLNY